MVKIKKKRYIVLPKDSKELRAFYDSWVKEKGIADPETRNEVWSAMQYCSRNRTPWEEEYWEEEPDTDE